MNAGTDWKTKQSTERQWIVMNEWINETLLILWNKNPKL